MADRVYRYGINDKGANARGKENQGVVIPMHLKPFMYFL